MNIAILIGVSKYKFESPLPACAYDAENMRQLLVATRKYDEVHCVSDKTDAAQVKEELRSFFSRYQNSNDINEALIYFSGHGLFQNDAMFCCSDFDANRPATTSISNAELDDLLRSVKPEVAVKIIDACQSGSPYIKEANAGFEKALGASKLNSFICMASSRQDQASYASSNESAFTSRWIDAALSKQVGTIFYRDIQAALADAFVSDSDQTPYFVSQGSGLEVFSAVTNEIKTLQSVRTKSVPEIKPIDAIAQLIEDQVTARDAQFIDHKIVIQSIDKSRGELNECDVDEEIVKKFYKKTVTTEMKLSGIPKVKAVAEFAAEQAWPKRYFVKINTESFQVRVPRDLMASIKLASLLTKRDESDYIIERRTRPSDLESTEALPFEVAEISYTSRHPSLAAFQIFIGVVHSLTDVMVLSATVRLTQKGWSQRAPELTDVQWRYESHAWKDIVTSPKMIWVASLERGEAEIRTYLESLLPKSEEAREVVTSELGAENNREGDSKY